MKGRALVALAALPLLPTACNDEPSRAVPASPPVVEVVMTEYHFEMPATVPAGRVVFQVKNAGTLEHDLTMVSLPDDFPLTIDEQLRGEERAGFQTRARVAPLPPGGGSTFAMDLAPGRYGIACFVVDADGEGHGRKGMSAEFRVT